MENMIERNFNKEEGQLFMLTALVLAVTFLLLAFALNLAIYNQNAATRTTEVGTEDAFSLAKLTTEVGDDLVLSTTQGTEDPSSYTELNDSYNKSIWTVSRTIEQEYARRSATTTISYEGFTRGTVVEQEQQNNFTSGQYNFDSWYAGNNTDGLRSMEMTVNQQETKFVNLDCNPLDLGCVLNDLVQSLGLNAELYHFGITNDSNVPVTTISMFEECSHWDSGVLGVGAHCEQYGFNLTTFVRDADNDYIVKSSCSVDDNSRGNHTIDFHNETLDGEKCQAITDLKQEAIEENANTDANLIFHDGDAIEGTYRYVTDVPYSWYEGTGYYDESGDPEQPTIRRAIYSAEINAGFKDREEFIHVQIKAEPEKVI